MDRTLASNAPRNTMEYPIDRTAGRSPATSGDLLARGHQGPVERLLRVTPRHDVRHASPNGDHSVTSRLRASVGVRLS